MAAIMAMAPRRVFANPQNSGLVEAEEGIQDAKWLVMKDGFGAQMFLTDSEAFYLNWLKTDLRTLTQVISTHRGHRFYVAVFFVDPGETRTGRADITYDLKVLKPDGSLYGGQAKIPGWKGYAPAKHLVELAHGKIDINFEVIDPSGVYTVDVVVHDNVNHIDIPLEKTVTLLD